MQIRTLAQQSSNAYVKGNHQQVLRGLESRHFFPKCCKPYMTFFPAINFNLETDRYVVGKYTFKLIETYNYDYCLFGGSMTSYILR